MTDCPIESPHEACFALWRFRLLVSRDMGLLLILTQVTIAGLAKFIHVLDTGNQIPLLFPAGWAARHADILAVGPYYCSGVIIFFAVIGCVGFTFGRSLFGTRRSGRASPRSSTACSCSSCPVDCGLCGNCTPADAECCDLCCRCLSRPVVLAECGECGVCSEAAGPCAAVLLVLILVMAVFGFFVAIFAGTVVLQQSIQRHMCLLAKRAEAKRLVVRDLRPENVASQR